MNIEEENSRLREIVKDVLMYAKQYAESRSTAAPYIVNMAIMDAEKMGLTLPDCPEGKWASDGMFGDWDPEIKGFVRRQDDSV